MNKILIFSNRKISSAPRILREIDALKNHFEIHITGEESEFESEHPYSCIYSFRSIGDKIKSRINRLFKKEAPLSYSSIRSYIKENQISILIIHEPHLLPLAHQLKKNLGLKVIFNAHEYHPLEFEDIPGWLETQGKQYDQFYRNYLTDLDLFINVCESIRLKCLEVYKKDSLVIPNATSYKELPVVITTDFPIRLIHHGVCLPSRKIENMIEIASNLGENYHLDLMLTSVKGSENYEQHIDELIASHNNVSRLKPVKFDLICSTINSYDIGLCYVEPINLNYQYGLPNKFYEFIQARLAVALSPLIEMKNLTEKYDLGVVSDDFNSDDLVKKIKNLSIEEINRFKSNSNLAAKIENHEKYSQLMLNHIKSLL